jgi:hypothetical protein
LRFSGLPRHEVATRVLGSSPGASVYEQLMAAGWEKRAKAYATRCDEGFAAGAAATTVASDLQSRA